MKQALIADDGVTVENVRTMPTDDQGAAIMPEGDPYTGPVLLLADDHYCGVGMVWNQASDAPLFDLTADLNQDMNVSAWTKTLQFLGLK